MNLTCSEYQLKWIALLFTILVSETKPSRNKGLVIKSRPWNTARKARYNCRFIMNCLLGQIIWFQILAALKRSVFHRLCLECGRVAICLFQTSWELKISNKVVRKAGFHVITSIGAVFLLKCVLPTNTKHFDEKSLNLILHQNVKYLLFVCSVYKFTGIWNWISLIIYTDFTLMSDVLDVFIWSEQSIMWDIIISKPSYWIW